jgi:hypothetical protein
MLNSGTNLLEVAAGHQDDDHQRLNGVISKYFEPSTIKSSILCCSRCSFPMSWVADPHVLEGPCIFGENFLRLVAKDNCPICRLIWTTVWELSLNLGGLSTASRIYCHTRYQPFKHMYTDILPSFAGGRTFCGVSLSLSPRGGERDEHVFDIYSLSSK